MGDAALQLKLKQDHCHGRDCRMFTDPSIAFISSIACCHLIAAWIWRLAPPPAAVLAQVKKNRKPPTVLGCSSRQKLWIIKGSRVCLICLT